MLTAMAGDQPDQTVIKEKKVKYEKTLKKLYKCNHTIAKRSFLPRIFF